MRRAATFGLVAAALAALWLALGPGPSRPARAPAPDPSPAAPTPIPTPGARPTAPEPRVVVPAAGRIGGTVTRAGVPVAGRRLEIDCGGTVVQTTTAPDGRYACDVTPGRCAVRAPLPPGVDTPPSPAGPISKLRLDTPPPRWVAAREVDVGAGASVTCDLELPPGRLVVQCRDATSGLPIAGARVVVRGPENAARTTTTDARGGAVLDELPAGAWSVHATARAHRDGAAAAAELTASATTALVDLELTPVGALDLRLVDEAGRAVEISAALRVVVEHVASATAATPTNTDELRGSTRPTVLRYDDLPAGPHRIALADEADDGPDGPTLRFQPIDAVRALTVDVVPGAVAPVDLPVRYRSYVRLRGEHADGSLASGAALHLEFLDARLGTIRILPAPWQHGRLSGGVHFDGYLAPGSYLMVFAAADGAELRERLDVGRDVLERTIRLPW